MNLVIDIGNTRLKAALFEGQQMAETMTDDRRGHLLLPFLKEKNYRIDRCMVSTVSDIPKNLKKIKKITGSEIVELNSNIPVPFINKYTTKDTLGKDRISNVAGACQLYPGRNVLIIDAGTAVKFDVKTSSEEYLGGNISPGLKMRFKALNTFTSRLPLVEESDQWDLLGDSTESAIRYGVQNGLLFETNTYIETLRNKYDELIVILTGGDAPLFDNKLKKPIFVILDLTLIGLNYILQQHAGNN